MPGFWEDIMGSFLEKVPNKNKTQGRMKTNRLRNPMSNQDMDEFLVQRYGNLKESHGPQGEKQLLNMRKMYQDAWLEEKLQQARKNNSIGMKDQLQYHKGNRPGIGEYSMPYRHIVPQRHPDQQQGSGFYLNPPVDGSKLPTRQYPGGVLAPGVKW